MLETKIEWTDHTVNFWWGCTKVSPACQNCYAETVAKRFGQRVFGAVPQWGFDKPRLPRLEAARKEALKIQRQAVKTGTRPRVFVNSMSDWLDDEIPPAWLAFLLETIRLCPDVDFQLLTKRPENWARLMSPTSGCFNLDTEEGKKGWGWGAQWYIGKTPPPNVHIGITVENQDQLEIRLPHLLRIPARVRFLSMEPLLGPVDFRQSATLMRLFNSSPYGWHSWLKQHIHWIIVGGESGGEARPMHPDWVLSLRDQCHETGIPYFFKQWGEWLPVTQASQADHSWLKQHIHWIIVGGESGGEARPMHPDWVLSLRDQCHETGIPYFFKQWGEWLPVTQASQADESLRLDKGYPGHKFPDGTLCIRVGKHAAGRTLNGQLHNALPSTDHQ